MPPRVEAVAQRLMQGLGPIRDWRDALHHAAQFPGQRCQHLGVGFHHLPLAGIGMLREVEHFVARGDDAHGDALPDRYVPDAARKQRAHVPWPQMVVARKEQFRSHNILSDAPHVLPRKGRGFDDDVVPVLHHLLDHDHGVAAFRHGMPGIDGEAVFPGLERQRMPFPRRERRAGVDRVAVHRRRVEGRRGITGVHGVRQHSARSLMRGDGFFPDQNLAVERGLDARHSLGRGNGFQVNIAFHAIIL